MQELLREELKTLNVLAIETHYHLGAQSTVFGIFPSREKQDSKLKCNSLLTSKAIYFVPV